MGADLVLDQWLDAVLAEGGGRRDQESAERHHQILDVVAHLDRYGEPRIARPIRLELRSCRLGECRRGHAARRDRLRIDALEQRASRRDQRLPGFSVKLEAAVPEARSAAILDKRYLPGDLVTLRSEERVERRILHPLDLDVVEVALDQVRIEVEWPRLQGGDRLEPRAFEIRPRLGAVRRCDIEQQVQIALDLRQTGVDRQGRGKVRWRSVHFSLDHRLRSLRVCRGTVSSSASAPEDRCALARPEVRRRRAGRRCRIGPSLHHQRIS